MLKRIPKNPEEQRGWAGWNGVLQELRRNEMLEAVGNLLTVHDGENWKPNPQIHAVLTVNADNLLELYCRAKTSGERILTMVDRASVGDHPDTISVYHLHGCLDAREENFIRAPCPCGRASNPQKMTDDLLPNVVFRESEYYETIASPASFVNHTPQSYLQRLNVLFIGTSLDDLNIRRWLYTSFRERVQQRIRHLQEYHCEHYEAAEFEAELESVRHFWLRPKKERSDGRELPKETRDMVELVMKKLGVQVVWCDDYPDMRKRIRSLAGSTSDARGVSEVKTRTAERADLGTS
jgi:hypothetical protein